ncbi:MAG: hypothetical protein COA62_03040 [Rhodobiaceae bacterium]|nr:MAG: hypothetical protein COA62_03040 [Rhodobiaceae bacterium]
MVALMLSLLGGQAQAADALFSVTGVAQNDVLNVRAQPHPSAEKVWTLPHDTTGVQAMGSPRIVGSAEWRQIRIENQTGWVNARFLTPQRATSAPEPIFFRAPLSCSGTEPFWGFQLTGKTGVLDSLAHGKATLQFDTVRNPGGVPIIWSFRGRQKPSNASVIAVLEETNACSDGMSDLTYQYSIRLDVADGPFFAGCCNALAGQPAP